MMRTSYQVFSSQEELEKYVADMDPQKEFVPAKKEINWNLDIKQCRECSIDFKPEHPAQHFCESCATKEQKENRRESVAERMKKNPVIANCVTCEKPYYKVGPRTKRCEECSPRGGKLVNKKDSSSKGLHIVE